MIRSYSEFVGTKLKTNYYVQKVLLPVHGIGSFEPVCLCRRSA